MMRIFLSITLINFVVGINVSKYTWKVALSENKRFPSQRNIRSVPALTSDTRRISSECWNDIKRKYIWCVNAESSCDFAGDHIKWVIQVDHDTEWMCYPSSCSANDLHSEWFGEMNHLNASASYCSLGCPAIQMDISGTSEDGQTFSVNEMVHSPNLTYDCAGAVALTEISLCEERDSCPNRANGVTTCSKSLEDRVWLGNKDLSQKTQICLPDECTNDANLEKMKDFDYAKLAYTIEMNYGFNLTREEIRAWYFMNYSCSTEAKYSIFIMIFGVVAAVFFVLCLGIACALRLCCGGGVVTTPIITVEFSNLEAFSRLESVTNNPNPNAV